jgi:hypothetical protein
VYYEKIIANLKIVRTAMITKSSLFYTFFMPEYKRAGHVELFETRVVG